jgi:hypothetical protein
VQLGSVESYVTDCLRVHCFTFIDLSNNNKIKIRSKSFLKVLKLVKDSLDMFVLALLKEMLLTKRLNSDYDNGSLFGWIKSHCLVVRLVSQRIDSLHIWWLHHDALENAHVRALCQNQSMVLVILVEPFLILFTESLSHWAYVMEIPFIKLVPKVVAVELHPISLRIPAW